MSNKTKRLVKRLGASALAVATVASGLSFGTAAEATTGTTTAEGAREGRVVQMIAEVGEGSYRGFGDSSNSSLVSFTPTYDTAKKTAQRLIVEPVGNGKFKLRSAENGDQCFYMSHTTLGYWIQYNSCDAPSSTWTQDNDGNLFNPTYNRYLSPEVLRLNNYPYFATSLSAPTTNKFLDIEGLGFHGKVDSTDVDRRTANVSGTALPNAFVTITWGDSRAVEVRADEDGNWSYELTGLSLGPNPVHIEQYVDQKQLGSYDFSAALTIADLTVEHEFGSERDDLVTLSGTAQPGAVVQALDDNGNMLVSSNEVPGSGAWSVELPAPNKAGAYDIDVVQSYGGEQTGKTSVSIDYGKQLVVNRPEDGFAHAGGKFKLSGVGEPGSSVEVREGSKLLGSANVFQSTQWNLTTPEDLNASEHTLTVTQKSKGGNVQTETVVVNPGEGTVELTAEGRFDADDATKPATAFGAAPTGSTVVLRNSVGQEIGRTVAKGDAYEIAIDPTKVTSGVNSFSVIIEGAPESKSFTLNYGQPAADVVVTKPAKNGTVAPGVVEFAGTGEAGSKIVVRGSVREVATATVGANGAWSAANPAGMPLSNGKYDLYFDQIGKGGLKSTVRHAFSIGETAPIVTPHTVTSPAAGAVVETLTPEFRGAGHEGATITVRGSSRVVATGTVENGQWVAKVDADAPLAPGSYNLYVDQSIRGTVVGTIRAEFTVSNEAFRQLTLSAPAQGENVTTVRPTFVGTATPGAEIRVGSSRKTVATATVEDDGTWRATPDFDLARGGSYPGLEVKQTTKSGKTSTVSSSFTVDRNAQ